MHHLPSNPSPPPHLSQLLAQALAALLSSSHALLQAQDVLAQRISTAVDSLLGLLQLPQPALQLLVLYVDTAPAATANIMLRQQP